MSTWTTIRCDACGDEARAHGCSWANVQAKVWEESRSVTYDLDLCDVCIATHSVQSLIDARRKVHG